MTCRSYLNNLTGFEIVFKAIQSDAYLTARFAQLRPPALSARKGICYRTHSPAWTETYHALAALALLISVQLAWTLTSSSLMTLNACCIVQQVQLDRVMSALYLATLKCRLPYSQNRRAT